jgi:DNA-binding GntR family transcriptional regulator
VNLTLPVEESIVSRGATVSHRVFEALRQAIVQGRLLPGNALSEAEVARQLGVSRQPVREAFIKLAEAGLVGIRPQRGTLVLLISRAEVENARFLREAIEVAIARKAALEATPADIAAMRDTLAAQRDANDGADASAFLRADDALHQAIARSAECEHAWKVLDGLKVQMDRVRYMSMEEATPIPVLISQHEAIVDAIAAGSPDEAEEAMRTHLSEILRSLPRIVAAHPEMFTA